MKKFLLTLIVTMLTCLGAWAQGGLELSESSVIVNLGETKMVELTVNVTEGNLVQQYDNEICSVAADWSTYKWPKVDMKITPKKAGTVVVPIVFNDYGNQEKSRVELTVSVVDKECATTLEAIADQTVALGYTTKVPVTFAPNTAVLSVTSSNSNIQASEVIDGVITLSTTAEAEVDETSTITITPKDGSDASPVSFTATIVAPVGIESISLAPAAKTVMLGDKVTLVPTFVSKEPGKEPASKTLTWTSSDTDKATVDENGVVTTKARGVVTITATSESINDADPVVATATITIQEELPVKDIMPKSVFKVGETYTSPLEMQDGFEALLESKYYYSSDNDIVQIDASTGYLVAKATGIVNITSRFSPTSEAVADNYVTWERGMRLYVTAGEFGLTLAPATINGTSVTTSVSGVTLNGETFSDATKYTIEYSLEGAAAGTTINAETGEVTLPSPAVVQQFAIVATLTPTDVDNYLGAVAKTSVLVEGDAAEGVVLTKHSHMEDGVEIIDYIEVYVPTPGAFGSLSDAPAIQSSSTATVEDLKAAANVKVTGLLKNSDVQELVNLIGGSTQSNDDIAALHCTTLDMGDAKLTEAITSTKHGEQGYKCDWVSGSNNKVLSSVKALTLPQPAVGVDNGTILPQGMGGLTGGWYESNYNSLETLIIPEGWTEVGASAWGTGKAGVNQGAGTGVSIAKLTSIEFPETLTKIGEFAFPGSAVTKLMFPPKIEYIGEGAFNVALKLSDVYFTGEKKGDGASFVPAIKYVHPNAFSLQTQMVNNCIEKDEICNNKHMPTMNRTHYVNGGVYACILHFPEGWDEYYTDVTRKYKVMDTSEESGVLYNKNTAGSIYTPDNWTPTWVSQMSSLSANQSMMTNQDGVSVSGGFPDDVYGYSMIWPSQYQMTCGYTIANAGYLWNGQPMDPMTQYDPTGASGYDLRGLYQFIIAMGNAPEDPKEWTFHYELDKWYTIALPFDMSPAQIKDVFGPKTQVCRFSGVTRVAEGDDKKIVLEFRNSVMKENDGRAEDNRYDVTQIVGATGVGIVTMDFVDGGIQHHWPYMIKPGGKAEGQFEMKFKNYKAETGILNQDKVNSTSSVSSEQAKQYAFSPILTKQYYDGDVNDGGGFKKNSYIFVNKINGESVDHQYVFFKGIKDGHGGYRDGGTVNAFTAYVQLAHGQDECNTFFGGNTQNQAPIYASIFGDDDEVNGIEKVVIACGTDSFDDDKIYTINGVLVNGRHLAPGLYIKNGKKFIVK